MDVKHRIGINWSENIEQILIREKIKFKNIALPGNSHLTVFDILESHPAWSRLEGNLRDLQPSDIPEMVFTKKEILDAEWSRLVPSHFASYPHPENAWTTMSLGGDYAENGVGWYQKAPYWIKHELKIGHRHFTSLFWCYPLLAIDEVFSVIGENNATGYEKWPIMVQSTGRPSNKVHQLYIPSVASVGALVTDNLEKERLDQYPEKYLPVSRGQLVIRQSNLQKVDFQFTDVWFGSGSSAFREVLVSNKVARLLVEHLWKGAKLEPIVLV